MDHKYSLGIATEDIRKGDYAKIDDYTGDISNVTRGELVSVQPGRSRQESRAFTYGMVVGALISWLTKWLSCKLITYLLQ